MRKEIFSLIVMVAFCLSAALPAAALSIKFDPPGGEIKKGEVVNVSMIDDQGKEVGGVISIGGKGQKESPRILKMITPGLLEVKGVTFLGESVASKAVYTFKKEDCNKPRTEIFSSGGYAVAKKPSSKNPNKPSKPPAPPLVSTKTKIKDNAIQVGVVLNGRRCLKVQLQGDKLECQWKDEPYDPKAEAERVEKELKARDDELKNEMNQHKSSAHLQFVPKEGGSIGAIPFLKYSDTVDSKTGEKKSVSEVSYKPPLLLEDKRGILKEAKEAGFCSGTFCKVMLYGMVPVVASVGLGFGIAAAAGAFDSSSRTVMENNYVSRP